MATAIRLSLRTMAAIANTSPKRPKGNPAKIVTMAGANEAKSPPPLRAGSETRKNVSSIPSKGTAMLNPAHFGAGRIEGVGSFIRTPNAQDEPRPLGAVGSGGWLGSCLLFKGVEMALLLCE
jgi:hypothetical protein